MDIYSTKGVSFPNAYPKVIGAQARVDLPMRTSDARLRRFTRRIRSKRTKLCWPPRRPASR